MDKKYFIDNDYIEHNCCYDTAIVTDVSVPVPHAERKDKDKEEYRLERSRVLECCEEEAEMICNALNQYNEKGE